MQERLFRKRGPGLSTRSTMNDSSAATGQMSTLVTPTTMSTPAPNWSHFDFFRWIRITDGLLVELTATSPQARLVTGSLNGGNLHIPAPGSTLSLSAGGVPQDGRTQRMLYMQSPRVLPYWGSRLDPMLLLVVGEL